MKIYSTFKNCHINIYHWVTFSFIVIPEKWENAEIPEFFKVIDLYNL